MNFLFLALKSKGVIFQKNVDELITAVACDIKSNECMFNKCDKCKIATIEYDQEKLDSEITWFKWMRVNYSLYEVDMEIDNEVITDERVMKSVENNNCAMRKSGRCILCIMALQVELDEDSSYYLETNELVTIEYKHPGLEVDLPSEWFAKEGNDIKKARDEACKSAKSEVINHEWYSKSDSSEEKIDKEATETLYLHDREIIIYNKVNEIKKDKYEDVEETRKNSKECIYDTADDSLIGINENQDNNVITKQVTENIDDIPSILFPLDDIVLEPFESDVFSDSTNRDLQKRAKRYREKLKENPDKYEIQRQKQLKRLKKRQKKVTELSEEEKHKQRKIWREQKRKQKENKKTKPKVTSKEVSKKLRSEGHSLKIKHLNVCKNYKKALNYIKILKLRLDNLRKRFSRVQQMHEKYIKLLKNEYDKVKVRNECMEISLRNTYNNCNKYSEKRLLKRVVINEGRADTNSKVLGLKGPVRVTVKEKLKNKKTKEEIEKFFIREDVSRCTSGKRECKTKEKKKCQIRYTNMAVKSNMLRIERCVADSLYEVDMEIDNEVITDERVMKSVENNNCAMRKSGRCILCIMALQVELDEDSSYYLETNELVTIEYKHPGLEVDLPSEWFAKEGNDIKKARDEACKSAKSEVINHEWYSKSDSSEEKIDKEATETLYLHDREIIIYNKVNEIKKDKYEDVEETRKNSKECIYDTADDSLIGINENQDNNVITKQVTENIDDIPSILFPLDDIVLEPFESDVFSDSTNRDLQKGRHPFHFTRVQELLPADYTARVSFCQWLLEDFTRNILWTDESTFTRVGMFNIHNEHYWSIENPHKVKPDHYQIRFSVNVWAGLLSDKLIGPFFIDRLNGDTYLDLLRNEIESALDNVPLSLRRNFYYQHDGCPSHFARSVRGYLNSAYDSHWIGRGGPIPWPPRSPDLTPLDFFVWGRVKDLVYGQDGHTIQSASELRNRIISAFEKVKQNSDVLMEVKQHIYKRASKCLQQNGRHIQQLM
ncbi:unnamed protein product [Euphydryas editha]|uniref:Transposase n=1 Tax=Euphydryas editha TaxID=104508 RepID=A0AAU9TR91_EUPED|nr:unnamed protein product [Euphydryas editha]